MARNGDPGLRRELRPDGQPRVRTRIPLSFGTGKVGRCRPQQSREAPWRERAMPNQPSLSTKAEKLIRSLAALAEEFEPGELELKRLEREAEKLLEIDAVEGHTVLGAAASLRGDSEEAHYRHRLAAQLSGESVEALNNYTTSLIKLGEFSEALEIARRAYSRAPASQEVLNRVGARGKCALLQPPRVSIPVRSDKGTGSPR